ncbi:sucrase ferredoxin [Actinomadura flavalba]|uniref:sucrase ferredoxin n=1 Tax=Actinomadura flavalba TaxID=1120938 RepID=UPI00036B155E|nr:sucrase ferredoxin [Actinomadura flavalba]
MTTRRTSCDHCPGSHSGERPCLASATVKPRSWLLIEHPGPWPERIEDLPGDGPVATAVRAALAAGVRPQLIRRTGRRRGVPPVQVYAVWSHGAAVWIEGRALDDPAELAGLDLAALAAGRRPGLGPLVRDPVLLVCTHGRRNACCARTGAPLARDLAARFGDLVWETTHVGGDRFAANLVCFPHGLYYGDLDTAAAVRAIEAYRRGEVALDRLRGRAGLPEPVQAAEHFAREHTGVLGLDGVRVESLIGTSPYEAVVSVGPARYRVVLERTTPGRACATDCQENLETYTVSDLTLLNEAALV